MKKIFFLLLIFIFIFLQKGITEEIKVFDFTQEELKTLKVRKIKGKTIYQVGSNENGNYLRAEAEGKASGLGKEVKIDLTKTPFLNITWKVEKDLSGIIENSKKGHDYAARVFVIKKTGTTPLSNRAINYVYSSNNEVGKYWRSPFTKKSIDYVCESVGISYKDIDKVVVSSCIDEEWSVDDAIDVLDLINKYI